MDFLDSTEATTTSSLSPSEYSAHSSTPNMQSAEEESDDFNFLSTAQSVAAPHFSQHLPPAAAYYSYRPMNGNHQSSVQPFYLEPNGGVSHHNSYLHDQQHNSYSSQQINQNAVSNSHHIPDNALINVIHSYQGQFMSPQNHYYPPADEQLNNNFGGTEAQYLPQETSSVPCTIEYVSCGVTGSTSNQSPEQETMIHTEDVAVYSQPAKIRKLSKDSSAGELQLELGNRGGSSEEMPSCSICGDVSSGIHYSVWACEGCKGFFKRAMARKPGDPAFTCYNKTTLMKNCDITRENRNRCRACRFQRCVDVGMIFTPSRYGSGKYAQNNKRKIEPAGVPALVLPEVKQLVDLIIAAHSSTFAPVSEIFNSRYAAVLSLSSDQLWPPGADLSKRGFQAVQHFAHSIPFVANLPPDLRTHLLDANALNIMILRVAFRFCPERESFLFPPGAEVTLPTLFSTPLSVSDTPNRLVSLARSLIRMEVRSEEIAFLSTLLLLSPDTLSQAAFLPYQIAQLRQMELAVLRAFHLHVQQRWATCVNSGVPQRPPLTLMGKMLALLSDIRALQLSVPLHVWLEPASPVSS